VKVGCSGCFSTHAFCGIRTRIISVFKSYFHKFHVPSSFPVAYIDFNIAMQAQNVLEDLYTMQSLQVPELSLYKHDYHLQEFKHQINS